MHILTFALPQAAKKQPQSIKSFISSQSSTNGTRQVPTVLRSTKPAELESWQAEELHYLVSALAPHRSLPVSLSCQSLGSGRPSEVLTVAVAPCRPTALWENSILPIQNPIFATELLCQRQMASPKSDPIGLTAIWSSLFVSSDGQQSSRVHSAQKHIRSRQKLA